MHNMGPSVFKTEQSSGVHASYFENVNSKIEGFPLRSCQKKVFSQTINPVTQKELVLGDTTFINDQMEHNYHIVSGANNQQRLRQGSHNS